MANIERTFSQADVSGRSEWTFLMPCMLAWFGMSISILLLKRHAGTPTLFCPVQAGCDSVLSSKYSAVMGIPLPWFGIAFYGMLLGLFLAAYGFGRVRLLGVAVWLSVMGASFSAVLMFIQFAVLHAFCPLCTASAVIVTALIFASAKAEKIATTATFEGRGPGALALAVFAVIPAVLQLISGIPEPDEVLAVVDGQTFTRRQMEEEVGASLQPLQQSMYALEFEWVRGKVDGALMAAEAAKTRTNVAETLAARMATVKPIAQSEIDGHLARNAMALTPENIKKVADDLLAEAREKMRVAYMEELARGHQIEVLLKQPTVKSLKIDLATAKISGPPDAKVQLVVFSDFQCHFCTELSFVLKRVRAEFPNDVLLAYRYFPVESHERAIPAAIAAECAAEQGAFWKYHDELYAAGGDLSDSALTAIADKLGLDRQRFLECQSSGRARAVVQASRVDAIADGLEGAPALFLNGKRIGGMIDYEHLSGKIRAAIALPLPPTGGAKGR